MTHRPAAEPRPTDPARTPDRDGPRDAEAVAHAIATEQHGVVARRQLLAAGIPSHVVARRVTSGRFRPVHAGVYLVTPVAPPLSRAMAAVLACGDGAVLSHLSGAAAWGLVGSGPADRVEVTLRRGNRRHPGIRAHRASSLPRDEVTTIERVPVTTPARTLVDVAATLPTRDLERAVAEAIARRMVTPSGLARSAARRDRRPGAATLRAILDAGPPPLTRSAAEERLLDLVRRARLPTPDANARVGRWEVDLLWRGARLVVEVDGWAFHASRAAYERDHRRDADLFAAGLRVLRVTWRQLEEEPEAVVARIAGALAPVGGSPSPAYSTSRTRGRSLASPHPATAAPPRHSIPHGSRPYSR